MEKQQLKEDLPKKTDGQNEVDIAKLISDINAMFERYGNEINQNMDEIERLRDIVIEQSKLIEGLTKCMNGNTQSSNEDKATALLYGLEERMNKLETKYLTIPEDELEPDMPAVLDVLNSRLEELEEKEEGFQKKNGKDYKTKEFIMTLIEEWYDILRTCVKYMCMSGYKTDLLDEQMGKVVKLQYFVEEEKNKKKKQSDNNMFA